MLNSNLNLSTLPESTFTYQFVNSALLFPCMEYQRLLRTEKVASIAENFSEYIDRSNRDDPDGKEEKPAHPCAGGFQSGL